MAKGLVMDLPALRVMHGLDQVICDMSRDEDVHMQSDGHIHPRSSQERIYPDVLTGEHDGLYVISLQQTLVKLVLTDTRLYFTVSSVVQYIYIYIYIYPRCLPTCDGRSYSVHITLYS